MMSPTPSPMTFKNGPTLTGPSLNRSRTRRVRLAITAVLAIACVSSLHAAFQDAPPNAGGPPRTGEERGRDGRSDGRGDNRGSGRQGEGRPDRDTTRPAWRGMFDGDRGYGGMGRRENWRDVPVPTAEEWQEVETFMRENSPTRLQMYEKLETDKGAEHPICQAIRKRAAARYRDLIALRDSNSGLYEFAFNQFKIEDTVLTTLSQIRRAGETAELLAQRQKQVHEFIANSLNERQTRLDKLKELVSREESTLARDRADIAKLEEKQRERFEREMRRMIDFATDTDGPTTKPDGL